MISVIIPAHNEEKYILRTVQSVKNQRFKNFEIIVVDDGSTDKTASIVKNEVDFVVSLKKKSGAARARNMGVKKSSGEMLVFLDADTILSPGVLEEIERNKKNFIIGSCVIKPDNQRLKHRIVMWLKNRLLCPFGISNGILFCPRNVFNRFGPFNEKMKKREEGAFLRSVKKHGRFVIIKEPIVSSMRRFERKGYLYIAYYWIKEAIKPSEDEYEVIR